MYGAGLDVKVYTLYGQAPGKKVGGMARPRVPVSRLGLAYARRLVAGMSRVRRRWGDGGARFVRHALFRKWRTLETTGEAVWAVMAGVRLAERFVDEGITHIHAPWADGPATAAWVASRLSGIPFSFGTFAQDIYPPDGALHEKVRDAVMVRPSCLANQEHLTGLYPDQAAKMITIYAGSPLVPPAPALRRPGSPFEMLALGRFVPKKGYPVLIEACRPIARSGPGLSSHPGRRRPPARADPGPGGKARASRSR